MLHLLRTWWRHRSTLGARGERAAARLLQSSGYRILAKNLRSRVGEIDIVAEPKNNQALLVVVEVKSGNSDALPPELHVNAAKQRKLTSLAAALLRRRRLAGRHIRFDVVAVVWPDHSKKPTRITHHAGAFEARFH